MRPLRPAERISPENRDGTPIISAHTHARLALFGAAGAKTLSSDTPGSYVVTETDALTERPDLIDALQRDTGITVLPVSPSL
ncbi:MULTISPECIES: hypothetical protein [Nocardiaceae]|uniref:hypothetical protein n=1 Tax=Nocardiaceae TaxID=85025 RepID=UPI0005230849|nr:MULTISPECIES: hypothetical protein [Rhodococcus]